MQKSSMQGKHKEHFSQDSQIINMEIQIIEKIHNTSDQYRKQREKMLIQKFSTKQRGLKQTTIAENFHLSIEEPIFNHCSHFQIGSRSDADIIKKTKYITEEFFWVDFIVGIFLITPYKTFLVKKNFWVQKVKIMDKCRHDKCCLDKCLCDSWNLFQIFPGTYL